MSQAQLYYYLRATLHHCLIYNQRTSYQTRNPQAIKFLLYKNANINRHSRSAKLSKIIFYVPFHLFKIVTFSKVITKTLTLN